MYEATRLFHCPAEEKLFTVLGISGLLIAPMDASVMMDLFLEI